MENIKNELKNLSSLDKSTWDVVRFGDVAIQQKGDVDRENNNLKRYIAGDHMQTKDLHIRRWGEFDGSYVGPAFHRKFEKGDILYGSRRTYLRKVAVANFDGITANTTYVIKANEKLIEPGLLPFVMLSESFSQHSIQNSKGSTNPYINWKDIAWYEFRLPSREMQKKLAGILWAVDEVEENALRVSEAIKKYKITYLESNFLNKNGKKIVLGKIGEFIRGVGYKPEDIGLDDDDHAPVLRANSLQNSTIVFDDLKFVHRKNIDEIQYLRNGDILICMSNGSKDLVGKSAVFSTNGKDFSFGSFCGCFRPTDVKYSSIVRYLFQTKSYRDQIKYLLTGSTINNLKPHDIESMSFNISENNVNEVEKDLQKIESFEKSQQDYLSHIRNVKQSIINSIF